MKDKFLGTVPDEAAPLGARKRPVSAGDSVLSWQRSEQWLREKTLASGSARRMEGSVGEETESLLIFLTLARQGHRRTLQLLFVALRSGNLCSSLEPSFVGDFEQAAQSR